MKKAMTVLIVVLLLIGAVLPARAIESPDRNRKCSLNLLMVYNGEKLDSGTLTICRVGDIAYEDTQWHFQLIPQLQDSDVSLENLEDARLANQLQKLAQDKKLPSVTVSIQKGSASFADLTPGLYVVSQKEACKGLSPINPFLISLPRWENGHYVYDLTAQPKVSLEPLPTEPTGTKPTKPTGPSLPQTGQLNWPVPVMASAGFTLLALGWYLCYGKKNHYES